MERTDRRVFLKQSACAAATVAGATTVGPHGMAHSAREIAEWEARVGSRLLVGDAELELDSVSATNHSGDDARPAHLRTHSISLLFALRGGRMQSDQHHFLPHRGNDLLLSEMVPPRGDTGRYFEAILN